MKVTVEQDKCVAAGQCVLHASEVFDQRDDDGVVVLLNENPSADQADEARLKRKLTIWRACVAGEPARDDATGSVTR